MYTHKEENGITLRNTKPATERVAEVDSAAQAGTGCHDRRSGSQTTYEHARRQIILHYENSHTKDL